MSVHLSELSAGDFARQEFGGCAVGDPRRQARVVSLVEAMAGRPGVALSALFRGDSYAMNASYDLMKRKEAKPDNLQSTHRERTRERCSSAGTFLFIEDTTEVSFSGGEQIEGLGPIGSRKSGKNQGFRLHSVLVARIGDQGIEAEQGRREPVDICGLADQQFLVRQKQPSGSRTNSRGTDLGSKRKREDGELESDRWVESVRRTAGFAAAPDVDCVRVADREGDFYEYLCELRDRGFGFVVRASQNRRLEDEVTGKRCGRLLTEARQAPALGTFTVHLRKRASRPAREAVLSVSALNNVLIQSPQRPGVGQGSLAPLRVSVVRVWEENPAGDIKEPLEWILLSSEAAESFEQAREIALYYSSRWIIEEFHKALKTGMGAERLQLEHGERLMAAISLMSVLALRLVDMRERVRLVPDAPALGNGYDETELEILRATIGGTIHTIREAMRATAKLGGFLARKGDGEPGMITLWRGTQTLENMKEGFLLAQRRGRKSQE